MDEGQEAVTAMADNKGIKNKQPTLSHLTFLKVSFFFFFNFKKFLAAPYGMSDLSSLTRDQTHTPYIGNSES